MAYIRSTNFLFDPPTHKPTNVSYWLEILTRIFKINLCGDLNLMIDPIGLIMHLACNKTCYSSYIYQYNVDICM